MPSSRSQPAERKRLTLCLLAILVLAACRQSSGDPSQAATGDPVATSSMKPAQAGPGESLPAPEAAVPSLSRLSGVWRVTGAAVGSKRKPSSSAKGALLDVSIEELRWSFRPPGDFQADDRCGQPGLVKLSANAVGRQVTVELLQAGRTLSGSPLAGVVALGWECGDGRWGPGAIGTSNFAMVGQKHLVMAWYGDQYLFLERIRSFEPIEQIDNGHAATIADDYVN